MLKPLTNNNYIYAIPAIKTQLFLKLIILEKSILIVQDPLPTKETVHHHTPLQLLVLSMTDGVGLMICHILYYLLKDHWLVIKQLIINAKVDICLELWIMLKFMV